MGWMQAIGALASKYGEYDIAKRQANSQAELAASIQASQNAQRSGAGNMVPMMVMGAVGVLAVVLLAR